LRVNEKSQVESLLSDVVSSAVGGSAFGGSSPAGKTINSQWSIVYRLSTVLSSSSPVAFPADLLLLIGAAGLIGAALPLVIHGLAALGHTLSENGYFSLHGAEKRAAGSESVLIVTPPLPKPAVSHKISEAKLISAEGSNGHRNCTVLEILFKSGSRYLDMSLEALKNSEASKGQIKEQIADAFSYISFITEYRSDVSKSHALNPFERGELAFLETAVNNYILELYERTGGKDKDSVVTNLIHVAGVPEAYQPLITELLNKKMRVVRILTEAIVTAEAAMAKLDTMAPDVRASVVELIRGLLFNKDILPYNILQFGISLCASRSNEGSDSFKDNLKILRRKLLELDDKYSGELERNIHIFAAFRKAFSLSGPSCEPIGEVVLLPAAIIVFIVTLNLITKLFWNRQHILLIGSTPTQRHTKS